MAPIDVTGTIVLDVEISTRSLRTHLDDLRFLQLRSGFSMDATQPGDWLRAMRVTDSRRS